MDLKAYTLIYKNIPWYYGMNTGTMGISDARNETHSLWQRMCMREPINLTVPPLINYEWIEDDYDED